MNENEKLITQVQDETMKALSNHNNILKELSSQNRTMATEFLNVAQDTANDPSKFKIISVALGKSMECVNVLSDKVAALESLLDTLQVKITEMDSRRSFNMIRSFATPRSTAQNNTETNTNINNDD